MLKISNAVRQLLQILAPFSVASSMVSLTSCGGGEGSGSSNLGGGTSGLTKISIGISWAARSRDLSAPSAALSAVITLHGAGANGADFSFTVNRDTAPAPYTRTETSTTTARGGNWPLNVTFYALAAGSGSVVGTASDEVQLSLGGALTNPNGTPLGAIQTVGTVASVIVAPNQQVLVGASSDIKITATDSAGNVVAVSPASVFLQTQSSQNVLQIANGQAKGISLGVVSVTATVDGITSPWQTVIVSPPVSYTTVNLMANDIVYSPLTKLIYASVPSTVGGNLGNTITAIDPSTGAIGSSVPVGSEPGPLALSDDGHSLYVGLNGVPAVRRIDVSAMTAGIQFGLGTDPNFGLRYPLELAVQPGHPNTVVVSSTYAQSAYSGMLSVFDNGITRIGSVSN